MGLRQCGRNVWSLALTDPARQSVARAAQRMSAEASALARRGARALSVVRRHGRDLRQRWGQYKLEDEISVVILGYIILLFGVLLLVHFLQPERGPAEGSSRSPMHRPAQPTN
jgi:hypothetical protein